LSTKDDNLTTKWRPYPANESGARISWDMGALKICGGCRIYWGSDAAYRPSAYRIQVSEDGTNWTTVYTATSQPASGWVAYTWPATYCRYICLVVDQHGSSGTEVYEFDYYSRITDRVAAEHGHGSGITPYLKGSGKRIYEDLREAKPKSLEERLALIEARLKILEDLAA